MIVDFHSHTFPQRIAAAAIDKLQHASRTVAFSSGTAMGLCDSMKRAGIDYAVVLPVVTNPNKTTSINDLSIELSERDTLVYFGGIHPDSPDMRCELARLASAGVKGVKIHPVYQNVDITDVRYLRILDRAGELGLTVLMHAGADIGFPGVDRCAPSAIADTLWQVGPVPLVCAHMGGWRCWERVIDALADTSVMLDTAFSLGDLTPLAPGVEEPDQLNMLGETAFCEIVRAFGAQRVLFGTDSPWGDQAQCVAQIRSLPLTPAEKDAILGGNAQKLLGL